jgi:hypothetical protein
MKPHHTDKVVQVYHRQITGQVTSLTSISQASTVEFSWECRWLSQPFVIDL